MSQSFPTKPSLSIVVEYELAHPAERVWRALTEPALVADWLMASDMRPVVGHKLTLDARPLPGWDGPVQCEVHDAEAPRCLVLTWIGNAHEKDGGGVLETIVNWTLVATKTGTTLRLQHAGFRPKNRGAFESMKTAWEHMIMRLQQVIAGLEE